MGLRVRDFLGLILLLPIVVCFSEAHASDAKLETLGANFSAHIPADWKNESGSWEYFDIADCFVNGPSCFGNNPTTPYGYPQFVDPSTGVVDKAFHMAADEAVVIVMRTPPESRYFAVTQFLMDQESTSATNIVFASLSDSLNNMKIGTTGSATPGQNVFDQYAAIVWTGDKNTFVSVRNKLIGSGLPSTAINFLPLPVNLPVYPIDIGGVGAWKNRFESIEAIRIRNRTSPILKIGIERGRVGIICVIVSPRSARLPNFDQRARYHGAISIADSPFDPNDFAESATTASRDGR